MAYVEDDTPIIMQNSSKEFVNAETYDIAQLELVGGAPVEKLVKKSWKSLWDS